VEVENMDPAPAAHCVHHPLEPAVATCARCGSFVCQGCLAGGDGARCPACRALLGDDFPLTRESWSFSALWGLAWPRFQQHWLNLTLAFLIITGVGFAVGMVSSALQAALGALGVDPVVTAVGAGGLANLASWLVQSVLQLGLLQMVLRVLHGKPIEVGMVFGGVRLLGKSVLLSLLMVACFLPMVLVLGGAAAALALGMDGHRDGMALAAVGALVAIPVLVVYAFFVGIPLGFAQLELVNDPEASPVAVIRACFTVVRENRWNVFGVQFMEGLVVLAGLLACCVGALPAAVLAQLIHGGLYLALRNGSGLPRPRDVQAT
jgi:hypothetical protein